MKEELERIKRECDGLEKEKKDLNKRLYKEKMKKTTVSVRASSAVFPYTEKTVKITGRSQTTEKKIKKYKKILEEKMNEIEQKYVEIEELLNRIESPRIRTIVRLRYIDGKEWNQIGSEFHTTPESIRKEFDRYIKTIK